jgi:hypothetical protein
VDAAKTSVPALVVRVGHRTQELKYDFDSFFELFKLLKKNKMLSETNQTSSESVIYLAKIWAQHLGQYWAYHLMELSLAES